MSAVGAVVLLAVTVMAGAGLVLLVVWLFAGAIGSRATSLEQERCKVYFAAMRAAHEIDLLADEAHARLHASRGRR